MWCIMCIHRSTHFSFSSLQFVRSRTCCVEGRLLNIQIQRTYHWIFKAEEYIIENRRKWTDLLDKCDDFSTLCRRARSACNNLRCNLHSESHVDSTASTFVQSSVKNAIWNISIYKTIVRKKQKETWTAISMWLRISSLWLTACGCFL